MYATTATGEGGPEHVASGSSRGGNGGPPARGRGLFRAGGAQLVEASQSAAREAGHHHTVGPLAKPLSTAALHQEEEEVLSGSCAQELHAGL